jgi:hypothetical protein
MLSDESEPQWNKNQLKRVGILITFYDKLKNNFAITFCEKLKNKIVIGVPQFQQDNIKS